MLRRFAPLWFALALLVIGSPARAAVPRTARMPALSPDGAKVAFAWHGDLWVAPAGGGTAARLAALPGNESLPRWSPDGRTIAFVSDRGGNDDLYTIPAGGGSPTRLTFHGADDELGDWTPDGKELLFSAARESRLPQLYSIRVADGRLRRLAKDEQALHSPACSPDGRWVAYVRGSVNTTRKHYHGSANAEIYLLDLTAPGKAPRRLTAYDGNDFWPAFSADGRTLYFVSDRGGAANVWAQPLAGGEPRPVTRHAEPAAVRMLAASADRRHLSYECDFGIWTLSVAGEAAPARVALEATDNTEEALYQRTFTGGATEYEVSPDGKRIAFVVHGEIFTIPAESGGEARQITDCPARDSDLSWSPDSKRLVYVCEQGANQDVHVVEVETQRDRRLTSAAAPEASPRFSPDGRWVAYLRGPGSHALCVVPVEGGTERVVAEGPALSSPAWSPDSAWIAYTRRDLANTRDIWVVSLDGMNSTNVSRCPGNNLQPQWTPDGRRIVFLSNRSGTPEVWRVELRKKADRAEADRSVRIDPEGIGRRARQLTDQPQAAKSAFVLSPDGKQCFFPVSALGQTDLWSVTVDGGAPTRALPEVNGAVRLSADGNTVFYQSQEPVGGSGASGSGAAYVRGGALYRIPRAGGTPTALPFVAKLDIDPAEERRQVFDEAWRLLRDGFYDERFHGVDWNAVRERYRPAVDDCLERQDFLQLLAEMAGELNASHIGVTTAVTSGGGAAKGTGYLGMEFDYDDSGPGLKVTRVLPEGPADSDEAKIHPGEYIVSIDGRDARPTEALYEYLAGKAGQPLELLVNSRPQREGARTVKVTPVSRTAWSDLEYEAWVTANRDAVDRLSGGRLAYLHIRHMDDASLKRFQQDLLGEAFGKDGLVLDVRWNPGGRIHDELLALLTKRVHAYETPRGGPRMSQPFAAVNRPMILLINQASASDAEIFPHGFRALGLGKLVGVPTMGAVIGTGNKVLLDGRTSFRVPGSAWTTPDGKVMENWGIPPDLVVENRPEDVATGTDRQLEAAVAELLKQLRN